MKINRNGLEGINWKYIVLRRKKWQTKYWKWWENYYFDFPSESEAQIKLFCLQPRVDKIC